MIQNYINSFIRIAKAKFSRYPTQKRLLKLPLLKDPFFIIVMPGGMHLAYLAMRFIPSYVDKVVILNGTAPWESSWARRMMGADHYVDIHFSLQHSEVLDLLFDTISYNFGIIDYDCYVFREQLFSELVNISDDCAINAVFFRNNSVLKWDVPETFLLFFNTELINQIRSVYGIGAAASKWDDLSDKIRCALESIGLNSECLPEVHKPYFDTLRLLMMLSKVERKSYHFVDHLPASPTPSETAYHVGGVSDPTNVKGIWNYRGSYFWYRVLEQIDDEELNRAYSRKFPRTTATKFLNGQTKERFEMPKTFIDFCEHLIATGLARS